MTTIDRNKALIDSLTGRVTTDALQVMAWDEPATISRASLMLADTAIPYSVDDAQVAMLEQIASELIVRDQVDLGIPGVTAEMVRYDPDEALERSSDNRARAWLASLPAAIEAKGK